MKDKNLYNFLTKNPSLLSKGIDTPEKLEKFLKSNPNYGEKETDVIPKDFDWKFYLDYHKDLKESGKKTEEHAKKHYLRHGIKENRVYKNIKKYNFNDFIDICYDLIKFLPSVFPIIDKNSHKKSLLIETRELKHNEFVIKNTIQKLGDGWGHIIYCHHDNYNQIKNICDSINPNIEIRLLKKKLNRNDYNDLLLDINFWNEIKCEKVLIYQTDTFIVNDFDESLLEWDYIGAPWGPGSHLKFLQKLISEFEISKMYYGNGGLSLRSVKTMLNSLNDNAFYEKIIDVKFDNLEKIPEDLYFSIYSCLFGKYPENINFSIEPSYDHKLVLNNDDNPFGFHKIYDFTDCLYHMKKYETDLKIKKQRYNINHFNEKNYTILKNHDIKSCDVSIIIPLYNYEKHVIKTIESVLNNEFKNFEIVIVNDCSNDNSLQIILPYLKIDKNITIIDKNINTGLAHSRNLGIDICSGDYVFMLDSDNEIYENCLSEHFNFLKENNDFISCYGIIECFDENDNKIREISNKEFQQELLKKRNYIDAMAMFNKNKLIEVGKYDLEMLEYGYGWEDYELWLKIIKEQLKVGFLNKSLSKYYVKKDSMITETNLYFKDKIKKYLNEKYKTNI
jgi:teichuronic acid biosynthesis glycosyltransferase TuaG